MGGTTQIRHLRAALSGSDRLAARLRLESLLGGVDFHPRGLPRDAVLVVRRLRDPRPGALSLRDLRPPPAWEAALSDAMAELARRAARPALGDAGTGAAAVRFDSREELLLCLARDLLDGTAAALDQLG